VRLHAPELRTIGNYLKGFGVKFMSQRIPTIVVDRNGLQGIIVTDIVTDDTKANQRERQVHVRFANGVQTVLPQELLQQQNDGRYHLSLSVDELQTDYELQREPELNREASEPKSLVLPITEEQIKVGKRPVQTGSVKIRKSVQEQVEVVDEPLYSEEVDIERVAINRPVEAAPSVRHEGDTIVIPLLEEVLFVEKRLVLREEIRIKKSRKEESVPQQVTLRQEHVEIERNPGQPLSE
jgi:uncharacterized protein (TIGR02271 family)